MPHLVLNQDWLTQPDVVCPANPLSIASGLTFLWHGGLPRHDAVRSKTAATDNTSFAGSPKGRARQCATGQVNIEWADYQPCVTSNGAGTGDFTVMVLANPAAAGAGAAEHLLAQKNDAAGGALAQACLIAHLDGSGGYSSGQICLYTYNTALSAVAASGCDGNWHLWTGVRRSGTLLLYRDGVLLTSASPTLRNISQANRYVAIGSRGNGTTSAYRNQASMASMWNRALSEHEIAVRAVNPWMDFEPEPIQIYWSAGGGATTITLTAASLALAAQGVQPQVDATLSVSTFALTPQVLSLHTIARLTAATVAFVANSLQTTSGTVIELVAASLAMSAQALNVVRDTLITLTSAVFQFSARPITVTGAVVAAIAHRARLTLRRFIGRR